MFRADWLAYCFTRTASRVAGRPESSFQAASQVRSRIESISIAMSASLKAIACFCAMATPKGRRGVDEDRLGARGERHEALLAGEDVAAALPLGPSGQRGRVEVPARLDEGRRPDRELGSREARQPALALLLGPRHEKRDGEEM